MKRIILYLLPQEWLDEIYMKGRRDAGVSMVDASYWFSRHPVLFKTLWELGHNVIKTGWTNPDPVRDKVYSEHADSLEKLKK